MPWSEHGKQKVLNVRTLSWNTESWNTWQGHVCEEIYVRILDNIIIKRLKSMSQHRVDRKNTKFIRAWAIHWEDSFWMLDNWRDIECSIHNAHWITYSKIEPSVLMIQSGSRIRQLSLEFGAKFLEMIFKLHLFL